ncbi:MAG: VCBS repeat-containing protein [Planctomycetota bacterium]|nr:VCBS repeat-containing protein [Planctomycetota bacterium]
MRFWRYKYFADFDLDGDRVKDVVISGYAGYNGHPLGFFLTAGAEGALADRTEAAGLPKDAAPILLADLDADGHVDLVSARGGGGIFLNDGKGKFTLKPGPATDFLRKDGPYLHVAYAEDFDADGDLDLVLVNPRHKSTAIFEHAGKGEFKCIHAQQSWDSDPIAIADFNADGRPDVAIGGPDTAITILLNAAATGNYCNLSLRMDAPNRFAAGARVEAFKAGELAKENALPFARFVAPADGFPIHLGLGEAKTFDLRVVFPGKESKPLTLFSVEARPRVTIAPAGLEEDSK